ncbi:MAG: glycosyltransferase [Puniceicoccaceae bacterium]|nr:MAG: glycosyltransferase [Puniceicoccaceae bacterium]
MRVLLTSHGSTGDIYPLIGYGKALAVAGHAVRYATAPLYQEAIESAGLEFRRVPPDWEVEIFAEFMRELSRIRLPVLQLRHIYAGAVPFMNELIEIMEQEITWCDVLVGSYFFPHYRFLAERQNKPFVSFAFCHNLVPNRAYPPEMIPRLRGLPQSCQEWWNWSCWRLGNALVDWTVNSVCGRIFSHHDLPPCRDFILNPAALSLIAVSPALMQRHENPPGFEFCGYLRWQSPADPKQAARLEAFCQGKKVPVLTFGSVTFDETHEVMSRFLKSWSGRKKIIIQSGWAGLSVELARKEILVVPPMSHDQLFQFASMVIHHGGAGTTASVLHAGVPHIVVPHIADQNWWADEILRLQVGIRLSQQKWPEKLDSAVAKIENSPPYHQRAIELAKLLAKEDGRQRSVDLLEQFCERVASESCIRD